MFEAQELRDSALKVGAKISTVAWPPFFPFLFSFFFLFPSFLRAKEKRCHFRGGLSLASMIDDPAVFR
jgi:hypothetical protein